MPSLTGKTKKRKKKITQRQPKTIQRSPKQSGILKSLERDIVRIALPPGKRISRTGNFYWETRINRSDLKGNV
jgi:hypothetical protein